MVAVGAIVSGLLVLAMLLLIAGPWPWSSCP